MKICIVGKFPPIQGGVSARTYRIAHGLARRGHEVHVVTNAREVESGYRLQMRDEDWDCCEAVYPSGGSVAVYWTALRPEHTHVPMGPAFVTRLASTAVSVVREFGAECIFSFYLEPYGVAGHLAASITGTPHLVKLAGSDRGRLWLQPDMRPLYDAVLQQAAAVFSSGPLARRLEACGVPPERMQPIAPVMMPTGEFRPEGETLEVGTRGDTPVIGIYGKIQRQKGASALLRALRELLDRGVAAELLAMSGGDAESIEQFDAEVAALDLGDSVQRLSFLPPWRVPAFLRSCAVVCSLEQDFGVRGHAPAIFAEGMAVGRVVVASAESALKQPHAERLVHGYNCFLVRDTQDSHAVAAVLEEALRADRAAVERQARRFAEAAYSAGDVLDAVEAGLRRAVLGKGEDAAESETDRTRSTIVRLVRGVIGSGPLPRASATSDWFAARLESSTPPADPAARDALRFGAQLSASFAPERRVALCFRPWQGSVPAVPSAVSIEEYAHDFEEWLRNEELSLPRPGRCSVAAIPGMPPRLLFVDRELATLLAACDGRRTVAEIARVLPDLDAAGTIRRLFDEGLLELP